jgi:hypothetical protein
MQGTCRERLLLIYYEYGTAQRAALRGEGSERGKNSADRQDKAESKAGCFNLIGIKYRLSMGYLKQF